MGRALGKVFVDTGVIVAANDAAAPERQNVAIQVVRQELERGTGVISSLVIAEYVDHAATRLSQPRVAIDHQVRMLERFEVVVMGGEAIREALALASDWGLALREALALSAAVRAGCGLTWSDAFTDLATFAGVQSLNPFFHPKIFLRRDTRLER